ncbi:MAG: HAD family hydrolase [Planctomycetota bacterium]|nr:MAG: HAD family hydrolase [Planctomycetota bacterium]
MTPSPLNFRDFRCWIFDLDGTLTVPVHDFDAMRREIGLPPGVGTLEGLAALPADQRQERRRQLDAIGWRYVEMAEPQPGASGLLNTLQQRGCHTGLVTRNARRNALGTLDRIGLRHHFEDQAVLSRDDGVAKPAPDPIHRLMKLWQASPAETLIVGDAIYDLEAGRAAGIPAILLDPSGNSEHRSLATHCVAHLEELSSDLPE